MKCETAADTEEDRESPSARRARIEISQKSFNSCLPIVALRKEGAD